MQAPRNDTAFEATARRASLGRWQGVNRLGEELLVWNYQLTPDQLPEWTPQNAQTLQAPGWPRSIQTTWGQTHGGLALIDTYECASRLEAHRFLVRLLGHVESPLLTWQRDSATGDVMFGDEKAPVALFARGNLVFFLRAADREPVPIADTASRLDETIISKPDVPDEAEADIGLRRAADAPTINRFTAALPMADRRDLAARTMPRGTSVALDIDAQDREHRALWYKAFSPSGDLWLSEGRPIYEQMTDGPTDVTLYAMASGHGAARRSLELPDRPT